MVLDNFVNIACNTCYNYQGNNLVVESYIFEPINIIIGSKQYLLHGMP